MKKVEILTDKAMRPKGPFSQGVKAGNLVFVSGTLSRDAEGNVVGKGDIVAQAQQVIKNIKVVLEAGGASLDDVVKLNVFLTDIRNMSKVLEVRSQYFKPVYPVSTAVQICGLSNPDFMVEIEATAVIG